jgi:predicted nucleotidyltransferase
VDALSALASRPGWSRHPRREYEFTAPGGAKVDLIPASPQLLRSGQLQWRNGDVMSLVGMDLAFEHAARHTGGVLVAPPPVVAILKMVAFGDRPTERERDLVDIAHLLDAYVDEDDERRWDETPDGTEFDLAPAYLLGIDIARVLSRDAHRRVVSRFLHQIEATESSGHLDGEQRPRPLAHRGERPGEAASNVQGRDAECERDLNRPREDRTPT